MGKIFPTGESLSSPILANSRSPILALFKTPRVDSPHVNRPKN